MKKTIAKTVKPKNVSQAGRSVGIVPPGTTAKRDLVNRQAKKEKLLKSAFAEG